jgi:hypothetical protein
MRTESFAKAGWLDGFRRWNRIVHNDKRQSYAEHIARTALQMKKKRASRIASPTPTSNGRVNQPMYLST